MLRWWFIILLLDGLKFMDFGRVTRVKIALKLHVHKTCAYRFLFQQKQRWLPFIPANISASLSWPQLQPSLSEMRHLLAWAVTSNQSVTFELMSLALEYSHLGGLVLTRRLLVQLIAICIALLVSQHCLRDISIFFPFSLSLCLSGSVLFLAFWGEELDSVWCVIKYSCLK